MDNTIFSEIDVNAYYFAGKDMKSFPRRISYAGRAVTFADGLRVEVNRGGEATYLFDMMATDGSSYRLRQQGNQWTLVGAR